MSGLGRFEPTDRRWANGGNRRRAAGRPVPASISATNSLRSLNHDGANRSNCPEADLRDHPHEPRGRVEPSRSHPGAAGAGAPTAPENCTRSMRPAERGKGVSDCQCWVPSARRWNSRPRSGGVVSLRGGVKAGHLRGCPFRVSEGTVGGVSGGGLCGGSPVCTPGGA
jgi:hypothetical protein